MTKTTYICDKCKREETVIQSEKPQKIKLALVGVCVVDSDRYYYSYSNVPQAEVKASASWCEDCRKKAGLLFQTEEEKKTTPPPTLEQQLAEIIRMFVAEQIPQQQ